MLEPICQGLLTPSLRMMQMYTQETTARPLQKALSLGCKLYPDVTSPNNLRWVQPHEAKAPNVKAESPQLHLT